VPDDCVGRSDSIISSIFRTCTTEYFKLFFHLDFRFLLFIRETCIHLHSLCELSIALYGILAFNFMRFLYIDKQHLLFYYRCVVIL
jgi:hypothetical protein